jgi:LPPG:FO 2-phospho-L-lactate transferase
MRDGITLALSGGVGGAKLALGLSRVLDSDKLTVVANTGDDFEHLGLYISPDVDTLLYTLAGINDPDTGWGRDKETWSCMTMFRKLGGETWFRLGDKDLGLHLYRTSRLNAGSKLSEVIEELRHHLGIGAELLPMCDQPVRTQVQTDQGTMEFQRYFVYAGCEPTVTGLRFAGADNAQATLRFSELLRGDTLRAIVICPSNPYLSIDPILAIPGIREAIERSPTPVVAVSPIVGGNALKGPTAKLMAELGVPVSADAVADHYGRLLDGFVLDETDAELAASIESKGISCTVTRTVMKNLEDRIQLAHSVLDFADRLRGVA